MLLANEAEGCSGKVVLVEQMSEKLRKLGEKKEVKLAWKRNALRHSFISYRVAEIQNVATGGFGGRQQPENHLLELPGAGEGGGCQEVVRDYADTTAECDTDAASGGAGSQLRGLTARQALAVNAAGAFRRWGMGDKGRMGRDGTNMGVRARPLIRHAL